MRRWGGRTCWVEWTCLLVGCVHGPHKSTGRYRGAADGWGLACAQKAPCADGGPKNRAYGSESSSGGGTD
jgi:hypothetical protein